MADVDDGRLEADARRRAGLVEPRIIDSGRDDVLHRRSGDRRRNELADKQTREAGVAVREMENIGLFAFRRILERLVDAEPRGPRHPPSGRLKRRQRVPADAPNPKRNAPQQDDQLFRRRRVVAKKGFITDRAQQRHSFRGRLPGEEVAVLQHQRLQRRLRFRRQRQSAQSLLYN